MAILNAIQRRSVPGRMLLAVFYLILVFGAVWMIYPFLMMLGGSLKTELDNRETDLIPHFLTNETMLFRKYEEQRYGRADIAVAATHAREGKNGRPYSFESFPIPQPSNGKALADWKRFLESQSATMPIYFFGLGHTYGVRAISEITFLYMEELRKAFSNLASEDKKPVISPEDWYGRNYQPPRGDRGKIYWQMRQELPARYFYPISLDGIFALNAVAYKYKENAEGLEKLNKEWGASYSSVLDVTLSPKLPTNPAEREIWSDFVRNSLSPRFLAFDEILLPDYRKFLQSKYGNLDALNVAYGTTHKNWDELMFPSQDAPQSAFSDAAAFVQALPDLSHVSIRGVEVEWRQFLYNDYGGDIAALNRAWGTSWPRFDAVPMPVLEYDWNLLQEHKSAILWDLITRNYRIAWDQVVLSGNGLRNTVIFCLLNIVVALIVNPLAAYALSRFQPKWGQIALFLLMATMAFPAEVTQIPAFLLLRDIGWLNTFAALVIPAAANGYSIFLLKGFFDSLPSELYEAATIDGSGELRTFFSITLPLSTPILAVVALSAFASAYGAFMFAILVCQKESMWTLMVYIYQLQQDYNPPLVFASLVIAALPTLLVFIFCQNVIMRGIVVPVEK